MVAHTEIIIDPKGTKTKVNRPPIPFKCTCGFSDPIVLPRLRGVMMFNCQCNRKYRVTFGPEGGNIEQLI